MLISDFSGTHKTLPRHIPAKEVHWFYSDYHQELPNYNRLLGKLEIATNLSGYCDL
ncbi:hypothetical protein ACE1CI_16450 [Aerosakkonemataceae cyanobacterium BLCC-F50]|uniref:Pyridoxal 5'-phosphate synthase n=1 Tax=Floridaenema flaviceps BLCC-F50 TaxID=3153642 RepID=A0ABV4XS36_9CYAN